ncbi:Lipoma HMGIC fusion partner -like protein, partial [Trichinella sp. T8]
LLSLDMHFNIVAVILFVCISATNGIVITEEKADPDWYRTKKLMLETNSIPKIGRPLDNKIIDGITVEMLPDELSWKLPPVSRGNNHTCELCKSYIMELRDIINDPEKLAQLKKLLKAACMAATQRIAECEAAVEGLDLILENMKESLENPENVCRKMYFCTNKEIPLCYRILFTEMRGRRLEKGVIRNPFKSVDVLCDECLFLTNEAASILSDEEYQRQLIQTAKGICRVIPQVKEECETAIDNYAPTLFQDLLDYLSNPKPVCQKIGFCGAANEIERTPLFPYGAVLNTEPSYPRQESISAVKTSYGIPAVCVLCKYGTKIYVDYFSRHYLDALTNEVIEMCNHFSSDWSAQCADFMQIYFKVFIQSILNNFNPTEACDRLHLCTISERRELMKMTPNQRRRLTCESCELMADNIMDDIEELELEEQLSTELIRGCESMSFIKKHECYANVRSLMTKLMNHLKEELFTSKTCTSINWHAVGDWLMPLMNRKKERERDLTTVGHAWSLLSLATAATAAVAFYMPYWLCGYLTLHDRTESTSFSSFRRCNYPSALPSSNAHDHQHPIMPGWRQEILLQCGRYASFEDIPTLWWKITTVVVGTGTGLALLMAFIALPAYCTRDVVTRTSAPILICVGCLLYPLGWGNKETKEACGRNASPYFISECTIGWAYYLLIGSALLLFLCAALSTKAAMRLQWCQLDPKNSIQSTTSIML